MFSFLKIIFCHPTLNEFFFCFQSKATQFFKKLSSNSKRFLWLSKSFHLFRSQRKEIIIIFVIIFRFGSKVECHDDGGANLFLCWEFRPRQMYPNVNFRNLCLASAFHFNFSVFIEICLIKILSSQKDACYQNLLFKLLRCSFWKILVQVCFKNIFILL